MFLHCSIFKLGFQLPPSAIVPQMNHYFSAVAYPNQPYYYANQTVAPPIIPSSGNFAAQGSLSVPITPQSNPSHFFSNFAHPGAQSSPADANTLNKPTNRVIPGQINPKGDCDCSIIEATDTIINVRNWIVVDLEENGECRIAGRHEGTGKLISSEKIIFVNDFGNIASDGKRLFKLCGPISWELYKLQYQHIKEVIPSPQLQEAFSSGFPDKDRRSCLQSLYRFLYRLIRQKPNLRYSVSNFPCNFI